MTHDAVFLQDICEYPDDPAPKCAYADWLAERGQADLAYAYHWAAKRGKHPKYCEPINEYVWVCGEACRGRRALPWQLRSAMRKNGGTHQHHFSDFDRLYLPTLRHAFVALSKALAALREATEIPDV